jgi:replicative DNA helicase
LQNLDRHLEAFVAMRDKAVEAVPQMQSHATKLVEDSTAAMSLASDSLKTAAEASQTGHQALVQDISASREATVIAIGEMQNRITNALTEATEAQSNASAKIFSGLEERLKETLGRTEDVVNTQLDALDKALEQELTRVIESLGGKLGGITSRFTEDYQQLTAQMAAVVGQARRFAAEPSEPYGQG